MSRIWNTLSLRTIEGKTTNKYQYPKFSLITAITNIHYNKGKFLDEMMWILSHNVYVNSWMKLKQAGPRSAINGVGIGLAGIAEI